MRTAYIVVCTLAFATCLIFNAGDYSIFPVIMAIPAIVDHLKEHIYKLFPPAQS